MKKFITIFLIFLFPVISIYTAEIGIDTDSSKFDTTEIKPLLSDDDQDDIKALSHFGTSMFIKKLSVSSDRLLNSLEKDPYSSRTLAFLLRNFRKHKLTENQLKTFIAIAKANPQALPLNVAALSLAGCFEPENCSSIDLKRELAERCIANNNPDKFNKIQFTLFARIVKTLSNIYLQQKEYDLGNELFEQLLENKKIFEHNIFLQQAVIFYMEATENADKSRRFLRLLPSRAEQYAAHRQELIDLLNSRSDKTDKLKTVLKHLGFLKKIGSLDQAKKILLEQLAKRPSDPILQINLAEFLSAV
jgi:tetratricopeptide (TPR) repeat protein